MTTENPDEPPKSVDFYVLPEESMKPYVRLYFISNFEWWPYPFAAFPLAGFFGFPFFFAPGWANGWPFGFSMDAVWSAGMSAIVWVMFMSLTVGLGAALCRFIVHRGGVRLAWTVFMLWLTIASVTSGALAVLSYRECYSSAREMWPNGYGL